MMFVFHTALFPTDLGTVRNLVATASNSTAIVVTWMVRHYCLQAVRERIKKERLEHENLYIFTKLNAFNLSASLFTRNQSPQPSILTQQLQ